MNYLIVSCSTYDMAGRAMIQGAINGISMFDRHAHFCSLEQPEHHKNWIGWYREPESNNEAFEWADCILDIAGLHTNQGNKYTWLELRKKYNKPYFFMSQSFLSNVDKALFEDAVVFARGPRASTKLQEKGIVNTISPDLSFLVKPLIIRDKQMHLVTPRRVYSTHVGKFWEGMETTVDPEKDIQIIEKPSQGDTIWEPSLNIPSFTGTPEEIFGLVMQAGEVYTSRYQIAVAAVLSGKKPLIFQTPNVEYNDKYDDLMYWHGKNPYSICRDVVSACRKVYEDVL